MDDAQDNDPSRKTSVRNDVACARNALLAQLRRSSGAARITSGQLRRRGLNPIDEQRRYLWIFVGEVPGDESKIGTRLKLPLEMLHSLRAFAASMIARASAMT